MNAHLAYLRFALSQRLWAPALGLAGGLLALILPWLPGNRLGIPRGWEATMPVLVVVAGVAVAALLGVTAALEDRQSATFALARPLGARRLALLRLGLDLTLTLAAAAMTAAPLQVGLLFWGAAASPLDLHTAAGSILSFPLLALLVIRLIAELVTAAATDRSPTLALDLVAAASLGWLWLTTASLPMWFESSFSQAATAIAAVGTTAALTIAAVRRLAIGRGDVRRAHWAGALTVAVLAAPLALGMQGWKRHVDTPARAAELDPILEATPVGLGGLLLLRGQTPLRVDLPVHALLDPASSSPAPAVDWVIPSSTSEDLAIALRSTGRDELEVELLRRDEESGAVLVQPTGVVLDRRRWAGPSLTLAVSNDGRRLAWLRGDQLLLWETSSGRLLGSFRVERRMAPRHLYFQGDRPAVARLAGIDGGSGLVVESFAPGEPTRATVLDAPSGDSATLGVHGDRLAVVGRGEAVVATLAGELIYRTRLENQRLPFLAFGMLADRSLVVSTWDSTDRGFERFGADGTPLGRIPMPDGGFPCGWVDDDTLLVRTEQGLTTIQITTGAVGPLVPTTERWTCTAPSFQQSLSRGAVVVRDEETRVLALWSQSEQRPIPLLELAARRPAG
jgi:hypothetical protein